jgi:hypothetical protein
LLQIDVWKNKSDWENKLRKCINNRTSENKAKEHMNTSNVKQYYFLCENHEYLDHEILLNIEQLKSKI